MFIRESLSAGDNGSPLQHTEIAACSERDFAGARGNIGSACHVKSSGSTFTASCNTIDFVAFQAIKK
jgi:hypothetical protein